MSGPEPAEFGWWLASRAAGVVALLCITVSWAWVWRWPVACPLDA